MLFFSVGFLMYRQGEEVGGLTYKEGNMVQNQVAIGSFL